MTDIVERLNREVNRAGDEWAYAILMQNAAREITRLRSELEQARNVIDLADVCLTLEHARKFIVSREKMHPDGVKLYDHTVAMVKRATLAFSSTKCKGDGQ